MRTVGYLVYAAVLLIAAYAAFRLIVRRTTRTEES
jgi:hypothetical protein